MIFFFATLRKYHEEPKMFMFSTTLLYEYESVYGAVANSIWAFLFEQNRNRRWWREECTAAGHDAALSKSTPAPPP